MVCFLDKAQLAAMRRKGIGLNGQDDKLTCRLQQLRFKNLLPENPEEDEYTVGLILALAQNRFYSNPLDLGMRQGVPRPTTTKSFTNLKVRLITHDYNESKFIVYTGHVTAVFLERFQSPHIAPIGNDTGLKIDYVCIPIWPILGLRERLGKALGEELVGPFDQDAMETWMEDTTERVRFVGKKRQGTKASCRPRKMRFARS